MFNKDDIIYEADYAKAWEDSVRMSDLFEPGDMLATYSPQQTRAALHAIRQYDGMKAKLDHTREVIRLLTSELEKPV